MTETLERPRVPATPLPREQRGSTGWVRHWISGAGVAGALTIATYLYYGYTYAGWPGTAMLDFVLRVNGELQNDWQTDQPAPHWVVTHFLALFPESWLEGVVLALWVVGLGVLWGGFAEVCRALGTSRLVALGAGLVAVPTGFGGIGWSEPLFGSMYPSQSAFAFSVAALASALFGRCALAGSLVGVAMLLHPSAGALAVPIVAVVLVAMVGWNWQGAARFTIPLFALALPALIPVVIGQGSPSTLSARERFELLALVRQPHHVLYSHFEGYEYARTALWACLGIVGVVLLRGRRPVRALAAGGLAAIVGLAIGAVASAREAPLLLLQAQLGRLSPYLIFVGLVIGAAALAQVGKSWGAAALLATAIVAHPITNGLTGSLVSVSGVEALLLLLALGTAAVAVPALGRTRDESLSHWLAVGGALGAILLLSFALTSPSYRTVTARTGLADLRTPETLLVCIVIVLAAVIVYVGLARTTLAAGYANSSLVLAAALGALVVANAAALVRAEEYGSRPTAVDVAWRDIAAVTRASTQPTDVILTPPQNSGFRFLSHRPVVVEFGSFRYDSEDVNWARRIADSTGDPRTVDPAFGTDVYARNSLMAEAYDRNVERSRVAVCRYRVANVVAEAPVTVPPWLVRVAANPVYVLLRVKPDAC